MARRQMNELVHHLRRAVLLQDGAGLTDGQLLECFLSRREQAAMEALVHRHAAMVWSVCFRVLRNHHDAEDAFQATFVVLVRKASSIMPREKVANWLYGVAHQTARKARATAGRRNCRERLLPHMSEPAAAEPDHWPELEPLLDRELSRLPEKYRVALVLCDLEGRTRKEAARQLGLPEGTLAGHLTRGRALLAKRLSKYAPPLSGGVLAATLAQKSASAAVPTGLLIATLKVVALEAGGQTAAVLSPAVALLIRGVMKAMLLQKLKIGIYALLIAIALAAAGVGGISAGNLAGSSQANPQGQRTLQPALGDRGVGVAQPPAKQDYGGIDPAVVAAWEKAGAEFGWHMNSDSAYFAWDFELGRPAAPGAVPGFKFIRPPPGGYASLPAPAVPFALQPYNYFSDEDAAQLAGLGQMQALMLHSRRVTEKGLKHLALHRQLRRLDLRQAKLTDTDLKELSRLTQLEMLDLGATNVTNNGLQELAGLKQLRHLYLANCKLSDAAVRNLAGLKQLQSLHLGQTQLTDAGLKDLAGLTQLHLLYLNNTDVTDAGLKDLAELRQMQQLNLTATNVTGSGLKELAGLEQLQGLSLLGGKKVAQAHLKDLAGLKKLQTLSLIFSGSITVDPNELAALTQPQSLSLSGPGVTDACVKELAGLKQLRMLRLGATQVTEAGLGELKGLKQLKKLVVRQTPVTHSGLKRLAGLTQLRDLDLGITQVTDAGLKELAALTQLQTLNLDQTHVTGAGLKQLAGLKGLESLDLSSTPLTDAGIKELAGLQHLQTLNVSKTLLTDGDLMVIAALERLQTLDLSSTKVTDAGLQELQGLEKLRRVQCYSTNVTTEGVAAFERALPKCRIAMTLEF